MLRRASQAEEYCKQRSSKSSPFQIVGYYQANELVTDHELGPYGKKICEKIRAQSPATAVLLVSHRIPTHVSWKCESSRHRADCPPRACS